MVTLQSGSSGTSSLASYGRVSGIKHLHKTCIYKIDNFTYGQY